MKIERDGYHFVESDDAASARKFFGFPTDWPCEVFQLPSRNDMGGERRTIWKLPAKLK